MCVRACVCVSVCVCVSPGYIFVRRHRVHVACVTGLVSAAFALRPSHVLSYVATNIIRRVPASRSHVAAAFTLRAPRIASYHVTSRQRGSTSESFLSANCGVASQVCPRIGPGAPG